MAKTALITGIDSSAIALAVCRSLLDGGYDVVATTSDGRFEAGSDERVALEQHQTDDVRIEFEIVNLDSTTSVTHCIESLKVRSYDVIVNCASVLALTTDGSLRDESVDFDYVEFVRVLEANVAPVAGICLGLREHINSGGSVINVTSSAAREGGFATISYNAGKAAIESLTKSLANALGPSRGIRVNSIAPGWIPPSTDAAAKGVIAIANALTPSTAIGSPEDVVAAVHYLINSSFHNGSVLALDGGITSSYLPYMLESLELRGLVSSDVLETIANLIDRSKADLG